MAPTSASQVHTKKYLAWEQCFAQNTGTNYYYVASCTLIDQNICQKYRHCTYSSRKNDNIRTIRTSRQSRAIKVLVVCRSIKYHAHHRQIGSDLKYTKIWVMGYHIIKLLPSQSLYHL